METYRRRNLGSLQCGIWRVHPCVVSTIRLVVLRVGILRPFHLLVASISSVVKVGKLKLGLVQQRFPDWEILESRVIPGCPKVVLRILQRVIGNQVVLYIVDSDSHRLFEQPILLELVRVYKRADEPAVCILVRIIIMFIL